MHGARAAAVRDPAAHRAGAPAVGRRVDARAGGVRARQPRRAPAGPRTLVVGRRPHTRCRMPRGGRFVLAGSSRAAPPVADRRAAHRAAVVAWCRPRAALRARVDGRGGAAALRAGPVPRAAGRAAARFAWRPRRLVVAHEFAASSSAARAAARMAVARRRAVPGGAGRSRARAAPGARPRRLAHRAHRGGARTHRRVSTDDPGRPAPGRRRTSHHGQPEQPADPRLRCGLGLDGLLASRAGRAGSARAVRRRARERRAAAAAGARDGPRAGRREPLAGTPRTPSRRRAQLQPGARVARIVRGRGRDAGACRAAALRHAGRRAQPAHAAA